MAERGIQIVKSMWRKEKDKNKALLAYRTTPLESLYRPDELMMGRKLRSEVPQLETTSTNLETFGNRNNSLKARQKRNFDRTKQVKDPLDFSEGDQVWVKVDHKDEGKLGTVRFRSEEPDSYWVEVNGRLLRRTSIHLRKLQPEGPEETDPPIPANAGDQVREEGSLTERTPSARGGTDMPRSSRGRVVKGRNDPDYFYY
jgi:hypothetical protein